ncbi:MAG: tetratricopeptide repeat protein [Magnetococcales bacterium]|nr:tetratricopeptide repeat protein [Magnetococcales bacterium]
MTRQSHRVKSVQQALQKAATLQRSGRSQAAAALYRQVLHAMPLHPEANHNLGRLALRDGDFLVAFTHCKRALEVDPASAGHWLCCLEVLLQNGEPEAFEQVLAQGRQMGLQGEAVERLIQRLDQEKLARRQLIELFNQGRYPEMERVAGGMTERLPGQAVGWKMLGVARLRQGRLDEALEPLRKALALLPGDAEVHGLIGCTHHESGHLDAAETAYRRALELHPGSVDFHNNLGLLLHDQGRFDDAGAAFRQALGLQPECAEAHYNLGNTLRERNRLSDAETSYRLALTHQPDCVPALCNLGLTLHEQFRLDEGEICLRLALERQPDHLESLMNLGDTLFVQKRYVEAGEIFRRVLRLKPDADNALSSASHCAMMVCQWQGVTGDVAALREAVAQGVVEQPFSLLAQFDEGAVHRRASRAYVVKYAEKILRSPPLVDPARHPRRKRIRIGYLSADFREHPVTQLLAAVIEAHDRERFVVHCYSYGPDMEDAGRQRIIRASDVFRDLHALSDHDSGLRIAGDGIDILFELTGFMQHFRPRITAWRPAPILVNFGYPGTMGHARMADYKITDPIATPLDGVDDFSETMAFLNHCIQPNDRTRPIGPIPSRGEAGLPEEGFVFCSFNQSYKFNPESFSVWCRLLDAVPGSVLWLATPNDVAVGHLRQEAASRGVDPDRLRFAPRTPTLADHFGRLTLAHLALDTFPFNSHTTASDALWSGVPMITRQGATFVSRIAASLLHGVGLPELVTGSWEEYFELAVALARDPVRLQGLRERLWVNRLTHPLFDTERFARDLERICERMWQDHGAGRKEMIVLR